MTENVKPPKVLQSYMQKLKGSFKWEARVYITDEQSLNEYIRQLQKSRNSCLVHFKTGESQHLIESSQNSFGGLAQTTRSTTVGPPQNLGRSSRKSSQSPTKSKENVLGNSKAPLFP